MSSTRPRPATSRVDSGIRTQQKDQSTYNLPSRKVKMKELSEDDLVQLDFGRLDEKISQASSIISTATASQLDNEYNKLVREFRLSLRSFSQYLPQLQNCINTQYKNHYFLNKKKEQLEEAKGTKEYQESQSIYTALEAENKLLQSQYDDMTRQYIELQLQKDNDIETSILHQETLNTLNKTCNYLQIKIDQLKIDNDKLDTILSKLNNHNIELSTTIKVSQTTLSQLENKIIPQIKDINEKIVKYQDILHTLHETNNHTEGNNITDHLKRTRLEDELKAMNELLLLNDEKTIRSKLDDELDKITSSKYEIDTHKKNIINYENKINELKNDITLKEDELIQLEAEITILQKREHDLKLQNIEYQDLINSHQPKINTLKSERDTINTTYSQREIAILSEYSDVKYKLQQSMDEKQNELDSLIALHKTQYNDTECKYNDESNKLTHKHNDNKNTLENIAMEKFAIKREIDKIDLQVKSFQDEIIQLKQKKDDDDAQMMFESSGNTNNSNSTNTIPQNPRSLFYKLQVDKFKDELQLKQILQADKAANKRRYDIESYDREILELEKVRRKLHNLYQDLRGSIRVICRIRPLMSHDSDTEYKTVGIIERDPCDGGGYTINLNVPARDKTYQYNFDTVLGPNSSQDQVFNEVCDVVQSAIDGYDVCLFSYGQTGSGKTHTMGGSGADVPQHEQGIIPRSVNLIFSKASELSNQGWKFEISASCCQIYLDQIQCLLSNKHPPGGLKISNNKDLRKITVQGLKIQPVSDHQQVSNLLRIATGNRTVAKTDMNAQSSRSHFIFSLYIVMKNTISGECRNGTLNLCDLAGSERISSAGTTSGEGLKQAQDINTSLSALSTVFIQLAQRSKHISFRNTALTELLQYCLSGDGKTMMIINLSPTSTSAQESKGSLDLAEKVSSIQRGKVKQNTRIIPPASSSSSPSGAENSALNTSGQSAAVTDNCSAITTATDAVPLRRAAPNALPRNVSSSSSNAGGQSKVVTKNGSKRSRVAQ